MLNSELKKREILNIISENGYGFPSQIYSRIGLSLIITSAFMSELVREKKLKTSNIRIGGSPIYYLPGHEQILENFISHLNSKEKEAVYLLKQESFLLDEKLEPALRVALRESKDFAIPLTIENRKFWYYYLLNKEEVINQIKSLIINQEIKQEQKNEKSENFKDYQKEFSLSEKQEQKLPEKKQKNIAESKIQKKSSLEEFSFLKEIFEKFGIEIIEGKSGKKEFFGVGFLNSDIGKLKYCIIYKNKKRISDIDMILAWQKSQEKKLPLIFFYKGTLSKKAEEYANSNSIFVKNIVINKNT